MNQFPRRLRLPILSGLLFAAIGLLAEGSAQDSAKPGSIAGVVRFTGQVPAPTKFVASDGAVIMHHDLVVDAKSKGLRHVVAYLPDAQAQPLARDAKPVVIDQRDMLFLPRVVVAQAGQKVRIENNDLCNHGVNSVTTTPENLFNVLTPMGQPFEFAFKLQKSPVQLGCVLHPWMRAWVYVLPHSYASVSDAQGKFKIDGLAAGKHTVLFVHADTGLRETRQVEVQAGTTATLEVEWRAIKK